METSTIKETLVAGASNAPAVRPHRWTRAEYERMGEAGVFEPEVRVELINGEIVEMSPQGSRHFTTIRKVEETLRPIFGEGFEIRVQGPLNLSKVDQPEPDVAVVRGHFSDFRDAHPTTALLAVEVSDSSLDLDRGRKLEVYARAGIPEYWIVNLIENTLEIYRDPAGDTYRTKTTHTATDTIAPAAKPKATVPVADLLP